MDKAKKQWLDDCKEHLVQATGSAYCAGCKELAQSINSILTELDKMEFLGYTGKNARGARKNEEENTMQNDFTLLDGSTIKIVRLGRDDGAEIIGKNTAGEIVCYIATENTTQDRAAIVQAIKGGAQTLAQVFDMWENGLGGSPFDLDYLPENYN